MEATILIIVVAVLYSIVALAFIVLPLRFMDSPGEYPALEPEQAQLGQTSRHRRRAAPRVGSHQPLGRRLH